MICLFGHNPITWTGLRPKSDYWREETDYLGTDIESDFDYFQSGNWQNVRIWTYIRKDRFNSLATDSTEF